MDTQRRRFLARMAGGVLGAGTLTIGRGVSAIGAWTGRDSNSVLNQARPAGNSHDLKIARVDPYIVRFSRDQAGALTGTFCLLCRIETTDGIVGWGEGTNVPKVAPIAAEI